jgi:hypothetical protein
LRLALGAGLEQSLYLLLGAVGELGVNRLGGKSSVDCACCCFIANMRSASLEAICEPSEIA